MALGRGTPKEECSREYSTSRHGPIGGPYSAPVLGFSSYKVWWAYIRGGSPTQTGSRHDAVTPNQSAIRTDPEPVTKSGPE